LIGRSGGLGAILDHEQPASVGEVFKLDTLHFGRRSLKMHYEHGPGARRVASCNLARIQAQRGVDLREHRTRADAHNCRIARDPAPCRYDDLVAGPDPGGGEADLQRRRAAADRQCVVDTKEGSGFGFELRRHRGRALGVIAVVTKEFLTLEHIQDEGLLFRTDGGGAKARRGTRAERGHGDEGCVAGTVGVRARMKSTELNTKPHSSETRHSAWAFSR
jgi:hypothetical protein